MEPTSILNQYSEYKPAKRKPNGSIYCSKLPVRPRPIPGEACWGYLMRVALSNGYETLAPIRMAFSSFDALSEALNLTLIETHCLFGPYPRFLQTTVLPRGLCLADFNATRLRWCPICLRESPHLRGLWTIKVASVCVRHRIRLMDQCPNCGSVQNLASVNFAQCRCGASLSITRTTEKVYGSVLRISQALEDSLTQISAYAALPPFELAEWIRLITYLGQFTSHFQPAKPGKIANLYRVDKALQMVTQTALLLEDWPKPFHHLLSVLQSQSNEQLSIRKAFGSLYRVIYIDLADDCFQFLRDAFEQYLCERWSGVMCKRHRAFKPETVANHPRLTWKHAAKKAGVTPSVVRHLIQAERISVNQVDLPSGRTVRSIDGQQLKHLADLAKAGLTLKEVAHRLALPERRVRELLAEHIIEPLVSRTQGNAAAWLISERQLERLYFSGLEINPLPATVTFQKVLKHWRLRQGEFKALVQALLSDQLIPVGLQANRVPLGKLVFDECQFRHWVTELRDAVGGSLSVDEAANRLGLKQQVAYELVKVGLLAATQDNGSSCRISPAALEVFSENYISLAEYARSLHRQPRAVLQSLKVQPVSGPTIDGSRQYFYRRTDLET